MRPRWRSTGRRRSTTHRLRPKQSGGWRRRNFLVSRGMGETQGKKIAARRCGIGGRGEAALRPDQPIGEAVWSARRRIPGDEWRPFEGLRSPRRMTISSIIPYRQAPRTFHPSQVQQRRFPTREGCSALIIDAESRHSNGGRISSRVGRIAHIAVPSAIRMITVMAGLFALDHQRLPVQMSGLSKPLARGDGCHARNAQERRDADSDRADD